MTVYVRLFAGLRAFLPAGPSPYSADLTDGATVAELLDTLHVPPDKPRILLVNGLHAELEQVLEHGDVLAAFPPIAGG